MGVGGREQIVAGNEAAYRRVNEAIERGRWPGEDRASSFRCECARSGCTEMVELSYRQYETMRADPRRFVVSPGHQDTDVEDVIERHASHYIVEKRGQAAAIAEATDPRS